MTQKKKVTSNRLPKKTINHLRGGDKHKNTRKGKIELENYSNICCIDFNKKHVHICRFFLFCTFIFVCVSPSVSEQERGHNLYIAGL